MLARCSIPANGYLSSVKFVCFAKTDYQYCSRNNSDGLATLMDSAAVKPW